MNARPTEAQASNPPCTRCGAGRQDHRGGDLRCPTGGGIFRRAAVGVVRNGVRCSRCNRTRHGSGEEWVERQSIHRASFSLSEAEVQLGLMLLTKARVKGADLSILMRRPEAATLAQKLDKAMRSMTDRQKAEASTSNGGDHG
jgi:hypothetical protein